MVVVDTSVWIEAARREGELAYKIGLENLLDAYEAVWCSPVRLEFLGGARKDKRKALDFYLQSVPYRELTEKHWNMAVKHSWKLRENGHSLPWNDILIATLAIDLDYRAYAKDKHYQVMSRYLGLRLYEPGYGGAYVPDA